MIDIHPSRQTVAADRLHPAQDQPLVDVVAGRIGQGVLFERISGDAVFPAQAAVHELDDDLGAQVGTLNVAVAPLDVWVLDRPAAPFIEIPKGHVPAVKGLDGIGRPPGDVDPAAIGLPSGLARGKPLVGVGDAPVVLIAGLVDHGVGSGIPSQPELLHKLVALIVRLQPVEGGFLLGSDDVEDILLQPLLEVSVGGLRAKRLFAPFVPLLSGQQCQGTAKDQNRNKEKSGDAIEKSVLHKAPAGTAYGTRLPT